MPIVAMCHPTASSIFLFKDTATTELYTLSLHDALPICGSGRGAALAPSTQRRDHTGGCIDVRRGCEIVATLDPGFRAGSSRTQRCSACRTLRRHEHG